MQFLKDDTLVNTIDAPGAVFGEVSVLRSSPHTATVVAAEPSRLRVATDGRGLLLENPEVLLLVAAGLAERLDIVTRYLTDLRNQYAGAPGLDMVSSVLGQLSQAGQPTIQTGSRRDPDPEY